MHLNVTITLTNYIHTYLNDLLSFRFQLIAWHDCYLIRRGVFSLNTVRRTVVVLCYFVNLRNMKIIEHPMPCCSNTFVAVMEHLCRLIIAVPTEP